jgi:capsule biosynthesis phosphatase
MKKSTFVIDVDGTICQAEKFPGTDAYDYLNAKPFSQVINRIQTLFEEGHTIIISTSRGMRTHEGDVEKIAEHVLPTLIEWLAKHDVPYHEIHIGKPWGPNVFYVDDRGLSPTFFAHNETRDYEELVHKRSQVI